VIADFYASFVDDRERENVNVRRDFIAGKIRRRGGGVFRG
jgi:hypothetical protein